MEGVAKRSSSVKLELKYESDTFWSSPWNEAYWPHWSLQLGHLGTLTVRRALNAITADFGGISEMVWNPALGN
jgi:hypothetical protein